MRYHKNSYTVNTNGMYNGAMEYANGGLTTSSSFYSPESTPYYTQNSAKFGSPYISSPAQTMPSTVSNMYTSNYSVSPTNRSRGANVNGSTPGLAWPTNNFASYSVPGISPSVNSPNGTQNGSANGTGSNGSSASRISRGLNSAFNSALQTTYGGYPQSQGDRYHWVNKPIVKA